MWAEPQNPPSSVPSEPRLPARYPSVPNPLLVKLERPQGAVWVGAEERFEFEVGTAEAGLKQLRLEVPGWEEHRAALAGALPKDDWDQVADAIAAVGRVRVLVDELLALGEGEIDPEAIPEDGRDVVTETLGALKRAADVLDRIS